MKHLIALAGVFALAAFPAFSNPEYRDGNPERSFQGFFNKLDLNRDGLISSAENADFAERMFYDADTNEDGFVSLNEMRAKKERMHERRASWRERDDGIDRAEYPSQAPASGYRDERDYRDYDERWERR